MFDSVSGRTRYDVSFIAKVVADKVENAIPLERQARMFGNEGLPVAPSALEDLYKRTADALLPLYERMVDRIMQCDILHVDETFIKLMVKGAKKCKQAYMWCRLTGVGPPMIAFHFSPSRSRDVAKSLLGDYSGTIIRDSYTAYEKLDCEVACCWAHVRRRFLQAVESGYTKAEAPLKLIQALYRIERVAKERAEKKGNGYGSLSRAEKCTPAVSEAGPGIFCAVPGSPGVGASIFTGRASRLLCLEYRRGAQKIPEGFPIEHRQQPGRTAQQGNCDHPKELPLCRQ